MKDEKKVKVKIKVNYKRIFNLMFKIDSALMRKDLRTVRKNQLILFNLIPNKSKREINKMTRLINSETALIKKLLIKKGI